MTIQIYFMLQRFKIKVLILFFTAGFEAGSCADVIQIFLIVKENLFDVKIEIKCAYSAK